jgi:hypothetical protein
MKMVTDPLTEIFTSLGGSLTGLKDSVGMILTLVGDLLGEIVQLITGFAGVEGEIDSIKIALAPITLALQAFEVGLKGFALLLAEIRVFFKRYFGSSKEYKEAIAERDKLNASMRESQGRINAYNASMLGTANLQKQVNDAQYELINGGKKLTQARKKELVSFIESAKKLDKEIKIKKNVVVTATEKSETEKPKAPAKKVKAEAPNFWQGVQSTIFSESQKFAKGVQDNITKTWKDIQTGQIFFDLAKSASQSWTQVKTTFNSIKTQANTVWSQFTTWLTSLPGKLQGGYNTAVAGLNNLWSRFSNWFVSLPGKLQAFLSSALAGLQQAWNSFTAWFTSLPGKFRSAVSSAFANIGSVTAMLAAGIRDWLKNAVSQALAGWKAGEPTPPKPTPALAMGSPGTMLGSLGEAVSYEQKHKPPGSDLVVANTSETVIPAAGGNKGAGMMAFVNTLRAGFNDVVTTFRQTSQQTQAHLTSQASTLGVTLKTAQEMQRAEIARITQTLISNRMQTDAGGNEGGMVGFAAAFRDGLNLVASVIRQTSQQTDTKLSTGFQTLVTGYKTAQDRQISAINRINSTLVSNQQQTNARLSKLETKFSTPGMAGGLGGASAGGVDAFTPIAQRYGLQMTSGYRPGDPGWHGANRARDFSNGTGPTPQMMQFAQFMASNYGSNLKELIYTPLGFSIKNGQKVPPYAQGSHYNHVHVAYALGPENGVGFTKLKGPDGAQSWEKSMVPGSVKVASITGNSAEGFGSNTFGDINVTVNAGSTTDPDALASIVALKIGEAVADARAASIFV